MENQHELHARYTPHVYRVIDTITHHLAEPLNLAALAEAAYLSPYYFHRIFTRTLGETPNHYVNRLRIERAANLLINNPMLSITDVALMTGFSSSAAFARSFKHAFACSAREWKMHHQLLLPRCAALDKTVCKDLELNVQVKSLPSYHVAYMVGLSHGYNWQRIDEIWRRLYHWAAARDLLTPETICIEVNYDDQDITPASKCRYYACLTVPNQVTADHLVGVMTIPAGKYAVYRFCGLRANIVLTCCALFAAWLPRSGYQLSYELPLRPCYAICGVEPVEPGWVCMDFCIPVIPR